MSEAAGAVDSRVGWGFDAHALNDDPPVLIGGTVVSEERGVEATSDGDVAAHAVTDALLGAIVKGDIGQHFPSSDPALVDADSMVFVRQASTMAIAAGWRPSHVDVTVIAESIRIAPYRGQIAKTLAEALGMDESGVSVKATSTDGLGFIGKDNGIAAVAVVTVQRLS